MKLKISLQISKQLKWNMLQAHEDFQQLFVDFQDIENKNWLREKRHAFIENNLTDQRLDIINKQFLSDEVSKFLTQSHKTPFINKNQLFTLVQNYLRLDTQITPMSVFAYKNVIYTSKLQISDRLFLLFTFMMIDIDSFIDQLGIVWRIDSLDLTLKYFMSQYILNLLNTHTLSQDCQGFKPVILVQVNNQLLAPETQWLSYKQYELITTKLPVISGYLLTTILNIITYQDEKLLQTMFNTKQVKSINDMLCTIQNIMILPIEQQYIQVTSKELKNDICQLIRENIFIFNPQYLTYLISKTIDDILPEALITFQAYNMMLLLSDIEYENKIVLTNEQIQQYSDMLLSFFQKYICELSNVRKTFLIQNFKQSIKSCEKIVVIDKKQKQKEQSNKNTRFQDDDILLKSYLNSQTEEKITSTHLLSLLLLLYKANKKPIEYLYNPSYTNAIMYFNMIDMQQIFKLSEKIPDSRSYCLIPYLIFNEIQRLPKKGKQNYIILQIQCLETLIQMYSHTKTKEAQLYQKYRYDFIQKYNQTYTELMEIILKLTKTKNKKNDSTKQQPKQKRSKKSKDNQQDDDSSQQNTIQNQPNKEEYIFSPIWGMNQIQLNLFIWLLRYQCHFYNDPLYLIQSSFDLINDVDNLKTAKINSTFIYCAIIDLFEQAGIQWGNQNISGYSSNSYSSQDSTSNNNIQMEQTFVNNNQNVIYNDQQLTLSKEELKEKFQEFINQKMKEKKIQQTQVQKSLFTNQEILKNVVLLTQYDQNAMLLLLNSLSVNQTNYSTFMMFTQNKFNQRVKGKQPYQEKIQMSNFQINQLWESFLKKNDQNEKIVSSDKETK